MITVDTRDTHRSEAFRRLPQAVPEGGKFGGVNAILHPLVFLLLARNLGLIAESADTSPPNCGSPEKRPISIPAVRAESVKKADGAP